MLDRLWLIPVGFIIGAYGTLIGAGGGFVLVPMLILLYPQEAPEVITSISLAVVFFNALSGSFAYTRLKRVDYRSGILFSAATIPGAVLGAMTTSLIPRPLFDMLLGILLIAASIFLMFHRDKQNGQRNGVLGGCLVRNLIETDGTHHTFSYSPTVGIGLSVVVGYVSSLLGIGGGIIHVPALVHLLNFPVHIATATSQFILAIMALTGTVVHVVTGAFHHGIRRTIALAIGVLIGAQLGAFLSCRIRGVWIIRGLAIGLGLVGIRVLILSFS
ncbi:MAG: hypothetical protein H6Q48_2524 [Deltaproteobacteria bacterium]|nr:hypothetical protein [Deltaproteobacteria bacterium]